MFFLRGCTVKNKGKEATKVRSEGADGFYNYFLSKTFHNCPACFHERVAWSYTAIGSYEIRVNSGALNPFAKEAK